jgi:replicative DNA helicase
MFIHRPEAYGILNDHDGNSLKGIAEIIVAKHRNGAIGDFQLSFKASLARFSDLETAYDEGSVRELHAPKGGGIYHSKMNSEPSHLETNPLRQGFSQPGNNFADDTPF